MTPNPPKVIFFDVGNVLLYFSHEKMFEQIAEVCETDLPAIKEFFTTDDLQLRYESGQITTDEIFFRLSAVAGRPLNSDDVHKALSEIFYLNDAILPLIGDLRKCNIKLVILSNISEAHHNYIDQQYGLFDPFDDMVLSYQVGAVKPDPKIYEKALAVAECKPDECFYTDDISTYIDAAREFGIDAEVFTGAGALRKQLRKRGLKV